MPVKVFKTLNNRAVLYSQYIWQIKKNPANLNNNMSIKKSQAILKRFIGSQV